MEELLKYKDFIELPSGSKSYSSSELAPEGGVVSQATVAHR